MLIIKITQFAYFILTVAEEKLHKTDSSAFISLLEACTFYQQALPSAYWWVRKDWKEKKLWVARSFSYSSYTWIVIIFNDSNWLIQGINMKNVFLRRPLPSFCFQSKFDWNRKLGSLELSAPLLTQSQTQCAPFLLGVSLNTQAW